MSKSTPVSLVRATTDFLALWDESGGEMDSNRLMKMIRVMEQISVLRESLATTILVSSTPVATVPPDEARDADVAAANAISDAADTIVLEVLSTYAPTREGIELGQRAMKVIRESLAALEGARP